MAQENRTREQFTEELARREAALAAREEQLAQEQAELAAQKADFEEGKKSLLNNGDKNFVNAKEKMYDHFPLTVHQMDIILSLIHIWHRLWRPSAGMALTRRPSTTAM